MAKDFKGYDKKFRKFAGTALKQVLDAENQRMMQTHISVIDGWYELRFEEGYSREKIRYCVYDSPDAEIWQKFRVSLKGLNTKEKLYCLVWWYWNAHNEYATDSHRNLVRVNNYLGALKRSGHLDSKLKVSKL